jgi:hypothetical protein
MKVAAGEATEPNSDPHTMYRLDQVVILMLILVVLALIQQ